VDALNLFLTRSVTYTYLFYFLVMQMDAEFKKEQNGTLFVPGGAVLGSGGGGWSFWASRREIWHDVHYFFFYPPGTSHKLLRRLLPRLIHTTNLSMLQNTSRFNEGEIITLFARPYLHQASRSAYHPEFTPQQTLTAGEFVRLTPPLRTLELPLASTRPGRLPSLASLLAVAAAEALAISSVPLLVLLALTAAATAASASRTRQGSALRERSTATAWKR